MTLIDGHNAFFALDKDRSSSFVHDINKWKDECLRVCQNQGKSFILVLDGSGGLHPNGSEKSIGKHGRLVYSGTLSADDWMEQWILTHKSEMVELVSADRRFFEKVRFKRVHRIDPKSWWRKVSQKKLNKGSSNRSVIPNKKTFGSTEEWMEIFGESD